MKIIRRLYSSKANNYYFLTTPIYYVNAVPHIGHLYTSVIADAMQRWHKLCHPNDNIIFSTGTDEHGMKIQRAASNNKTTVADYCKDISNNYKHLSDTFSIKYSDFIRTTENRHKEAVHQFWNTIKKNGHIYPSHYCGWYCVADETFLATTQLTDKILPDGSKIAVSTESGHSVEWSEEQTYMFRLSSFQDNIKYWLRKNEDCIKPKKFHRILMELADSDATADVSISRPVSRVHWGIPVPGDPDHTVYVWMDALVNYLTAAGYPNEKFLNLWPPHMQIIGKDILKFHGIYWPAFLMAADLEPPRTLFCHSHWTVDGQKMSKSKNNVVCPFDKMQTCTADGLRYFLLREGVAHSDGSKILFYKHMMDQSTKVTENNELLDFSDVKLTRILNSELADTLGNLLNRCTSAALNPNQIIPAFNSVAFNKIIKEDCAKNLMESVKLLPDLAKIHYSEFNFYKAIESVISTLHSANLFFETMKPWELKKSPLTIEDLQAVLYITSETLRVCGIILQPVIPNLCDLLLTKLNVPSNERFWRDIFPLSWENPVESKDTALSEQKLVLFRRILLENEKRVKEQVK